MTDDETKKDETTEQEPQDEAPQDTGPVTDEDPSSTPPASDASEADAPAGDASSGEASADDAAGEAAEDPDADLPWKERRRLAKSRRPHKPRPQRSPEERKAERLAERKRKAELRRKQRAAAKAARDGKGVGTPPAERRSNAAKVRQGVVVSSRGDKSITVRIDTARRHRTYEKIVRRSRTLHAHDERNEAAEGDVVRVVETRPLSKTKRWRLVDIVEKAR